MTDDEPMKVLRRVLLEYGKGCSMAGGRSLHLSVDELLKTSLDPENDRYNPGSCSECLDAAARTVLIALREAGYEVRAKSPT